MKQRTIARATTYQGIGLHTGKKVTLKILPAPENHGVIFIRKDLPQQPEIPAQIKYIDYRMRRTALVNGDAEIQTPEHFLASCYGLRIHNLKVEIDGSELPGADGSSLPFCQALLEAQLEEQSANWPKVIVSEPIEVKAEKAIIRATKGENLFISYTLDHDLDFLPKQVYELKMEQESFLKELAPARTFVLKQEVEALQKMGLGQGANLQNTLVIDENGQVIENTLRFPDEFVRHKMLDFIGDLFLLGAQLQANITASRSGHNLNAQLVSQIRNQETGSNHEPSH